MPTGIWKQPVAAPEKTKYVMQSRYLTIKDGYFLLMRYFNEETVRDYGLYTQLGT